MKRIGLFVLFVFSLFYAHNEKESSVILDDFMNVEALATGESNGHTICMEPGNITCPISESKVAYIISLSQPH